MASVSCFSVSIGILDIGVYDLRKIYSLILDLNGYTKDTLNLFIYSMFESLSEQGRLKYGVLFNKISDVLMSILIDLDENSIMDLLRQYGSTIIMSNISYTRIRFSMRAVLEDVLKTDNPLNPKYQSVYDKIKYLELNDGIIIP